MREEFVRGADQTDLHQQGIDRAGLGKQGKEEHGECGSHDQVGQINDRLEKLFPLEPQGRVGKPCCKQERDNDLRDKSHDPHDHGVF